jgi:uncharacterized membrane-anchored protein
MRNPQRRPRARLTLAILKFALLDIVGMLVFALGLGWFARGPGAFFDRFPGNTAEAVVFTAAGVVIMGYAASRILREVMKQHQPPAE